MTKFIVNGAALFPPKWRGCMIFSKEAQDTLLLLARRKQKDPTLMFWGRSDRDINHNELAWTCLACNKKFPAKEMIQTDAIPKTHIHGLECLRNHKLLVFI